MKDFIDSYYAIGEYGATAPVKLFITAGSIYLIIVGIWLYLIFKGGENEDDTVNLLVIGFLLSFILAMFWPIILPIAVVILMMRVVSRLVRKWGENYRTLSNRVDLNKVDKTLEEMKNLVDKAENRR